MAGFVLAEINRVSFPKIGWEFDLNSVLFEIGNFSIHWYGVLIALGMFLAVLYVFKRLRSFGINEDRFIDVVMGGTISAIVCARIYYVVFNFSEFKDNLWDIFKIWNGGIAIYGAIIGAIVGGVIVCKIRKVPVRPVLDLAGLGFLIGQTIGRWGNFFNVEAFGSNTDSIFGMTSEKIEYYLMSISDKYINMGVTIDPYQPVHPCFFYKSIWCLFCFVALHFMSKKRRFDGQIFLSYIALYSLGRFFIEGLRTDSLLIGRLRVSQVLAFLLFFAAVAFLVVIFQKIRKEGDPNYLKLFVLTDEAAIHLEHPEQFRQPPEKKKESSENSETSTETDLEDEEESEQIEEDPPVESAEILAEVQEQPEETANDDGGAE